jgi:DNA polymerase IIIc chi subunit
VIELVSADEQAIQDARERWKSYKQRGFELVNHDVRQRASGRAADSG